MKNNELKTIQEQVQKYEWALKVAEFHNFKSHISYYRNRILLLKKIEVEILENRDNLLNHCFTIAILQRLNINFSLHNSFIYVGI